MPAYLLQLIDQTLAPSRGLAPTPPSLEGLALTTGNGSDLPVLLGFVLTVVLLAIGLYFLRISAELGREAQRRARTTRAFLERARRMEHPVPVGDLDVDEVASLAKPGRMAEAS